VSVPGGLHRRSAARRVCLPAGEERRVEAALAEAHDVERSGAGAGFADGSISRRGDLKPVYPLPPGGSVVE